MDNIQQSGNRYVFVALRHYDTVVGCTNCYNEVDREAPTRGVIYTSGK